jgi:hypothetical protein
MGNTPRPKAPKRAAAPGPAGSGTSRDAAAIWRRIGIGVAIAAAIALVVWMAIPQEETAAGIPEGAVEAPTPSRNHIEGEIAYDELVPPGGDHNSIWLNCGVYREPVAAENAVHALEHGVVWITYQPDLDGGSVATLEGIGRERRKVIVSPVPGQESAILLTSWGWSLELTDPEDPRVSQYLQEFEGTSHAPEPGAVCTGGVGIPDA